MYKFEKLITLNANEKTNLTLTNGKYRIWNIGDGGDGGSGGKSWGLYYGGGGASGGNGAICISTFILDNQNYNLTFENDGKAYLLKYENSLINKSEHGQIGGVGGNASALNALPRGGKAGKGGVATNYLTPNLFKNIEYDFLTKNGTDGQDGTHKKGGANATQPFPTNYTNPPYLAKEGQDGFTSLVSPICLGCAGGGGASDGNGGKGGKGGFIIEKYVEGIGINIGNLPIDGVAYGNTLIKKIYAGDTLISGLKKEYDIEYTISSPQPPSQDIIKNSLPKGVEVREITKDREKIKLNVSEGNITFEANSEIIAIEKLKHKQPSSCLAMFYNSPNLRKVNLEGFNTESVTAFQSMFLDCNALSELITTGLNTKKVKSMNHCFSACGFRKLDLRDFNTQNVTDMRSMFGDCIYLEEVNLSSFNTSKVKDFSYMFIKCSALKTLDLTNFDTKKAIDMNYFFAHCFELEELDLSSFYTPNVENTYYMFDGCRALKTLDLRNFDTRNVTSASGMFKGVPSTCKIYVGENWTLTEESTKFEGKFIRV